MRAAGPGPRRARAAGAASAARGGTGGARPGPRGEAPRELRFPSPGRRLRATRMAEGSRCVNETWKLAKARARHRLESPGYPSQGKSCGLGSRTQVQVVDGSTGHGNAVTTKRCGLVFRGRPDIKGGREIVKHLHLAIFCVARAKCAVLETDCSRTALFRISNSEPTMFEFSQVMRASVLTSSPVVYPDYYSTRRCCFRAVSLSRF
jgi:hypothetical protein